MQVFISSFWEYIDILFFARMATQYLSVCINFTRTGDLLTWGYDGDKAVTIPFDCLVATTTWWPTGQILATTTVAA